MRLVIPTKSPAIRAKYVSASTASVVLTVNGTPLPAYNTTATSPGCSASNGGVICSFAFAASVGAAAFNVKAYDAANGGGNLLSQGNVTQTLVAGSNTIPVIMGGVTSWISVSAAGINAGTAGTTPVIVQAKDADGNVIVGPGNYSSPITIADGDTTGITTISVNGTNEGTSATVNSPSDSVVLNYSGKKLVSAALTPSATGVSAVTSGSFAPALTYLTTYQLPLPSTPNDAFTPIWIAASGDGNLWVTATDSSTGNASLFKMTTSGAMTEFDPGAAPSTALPVNVGIEGIAGTPPGSAVAAWFTFSNVGVAPQVAVGSITESGAVTTYSVANWCGAGIQGFADQIQSDLAGGAWFQIFCFSTPNTTSQVAHISSNGTITLSSVLSISPGGFVLGKDGNLYITGCAATPCTHGTVLQAVVSGGAIVSTNILTSSSSTNSYFGITQSDDGDLWLGDGNCPSHLVRLHFATAAFSSGVFSAFSPAQGCTSPSLLVNGGNDTIWAASDNSTGSGITEVIPAANQGAPTMIGLSPPLPNGVTGGSSVYNYSQGVLGPDGVLYFVLNESNSNPPNFMSGVITRIAY